MLARQGQIRGSGAVRRGVAAKPGNEDPVQLTQRPRDGGDRGLDLVRGVIAAEPEADALAAHVGDDVGAREPVVQRLRADELEGEEMPAPRRRRPT